MTHNRTKTWLAAIAISALCTGNASAATLPLFTSNNQLDKTIWYVSNGWTDGDIQSCEWRATAVSSFSYPSGPALRLTLDNHGGTVRPIGCGEIQSNTRNGYGTYEASIKTAAGSGLNTAFFTYIGPPNGVASHDEIDFEFLGKDPTTVQVNYWVGGVSKDGTLIKLGFDASKAFHNYSFIWSPTQIRWFVDGKLVHTTHPGWMMPKQPGKIFLSLWSGSNILNGWLGPFTYKAPVFAEFQAIKFTPQ